MAATAMILMIRFLGLVVLMLLSSPCNSASSSNLTRLYENKCASEFDCSYNGVCASSGECVCDRGWKGQYCEELKLKPARNGSGLDLLHGPKKTSTWGGSVIYDKNDDLYHMYASLIGGHCGIHRWTSNSVVVHASSSGPSDGWNFKVQDTVFGLFTHEPIVARAPTGETVLYVTHYNGNAAAPSPTCNCTDGNSASGEDGCANEPGFGINATAYTYYSSAKSPSGPWSSLVSLEHMCPGINRTDLNFAPVILKDGSVVAWTRWDIIFATNWSEPATYADMGQAPDFAKGAPWEGEDPSAWIDKKGRFHILSHNGDRGKGGTSKDPSGDCGRHFFSSTGKAGTWNVAPTTLGGCAFPRTEVQWADGTTKSFYRRERPHMVLGKDGYPVAITTAVIDSPDGPGSDGFTPPQRDASYTLLQEIDNS